ncbi:MAG: hypothetical protein ACREPJ_05355 [Rhodanobacteraceae bacterium]
MTDCELRIENARTIAAERDALKFRIDEAPIAVVTDPLPAYGNRVHGFVSAEVPEEWVGKRVRLVVED